MRYIFRLGARVFINCQYYGGQTTFEKGCIDISKTMICLNKYLLVQSQKTQKTLEYKCGIKREGPTVIINRDNPNRRRL